MPPPSLGGGAMTVQGSFGRTAPLAHYQPASAPPLAPFGMLGASATNVRHGAVSQGGGGLFDQQLTAARDDYKRQLQMRMQSRPF